MIKPNEIIDKCLKDLEPKSVLDLGCGLGRASLRFANKSIKVKGIDFKDKEISNKNFEFIKSNVKKFVFKEKYDLIIASLVLHFLKKDDAIQMIEKMKKNTQEGGFNFLVCMSNEDDCSKQKPENFYPNLTLLKKIYNNWEIVKQVQDFTELEGHGNLKPHKHNLIFMLFKKP